MIVVIKMAAEEDGELAFAAEIWNGNRRRDDAYRR